MKMKNSLYCDQLYNNLSLKTSLIFAVWEILAKVVNDSVTPCHSLDVVIIEWKITSMLQLKNIICPIFLKVVI